MTQPTTMTTTNLNFITLCISLTLGEGMFFYGIAKNYPIPLMVIFAVVTIAITLTKRWAYGVIASK